MGQFTPLPIEQQGQKISEFLPVGVAWDSVTDGDKNLGKLLQAFGVELFRLEVAIEVLSIELDINRTNQLIREWEISVGIPDSCFDSSGDLEVRRQAVLTKIQNIRLQTAEDFENLALTFGQIVRVSGGSDNGVFPLLFPILFFPSGKDARFTMIVDSESNRSVFPLPFPLQFSAGVNGIIECLFTKLKPANCDILFRYDVPPFLPTQLSGLELWLDATDPDTIIGSGGTLNKWNDKSGQDNDQTSVNKPIIGISTINGKNTIDFNGINQYLFDDIEFNLNLERIPLSSHTIFFVAHLRTPSVLDCFLSWNAGAGLDDVEVFCFPSNGNLTVKGDTGFGSHVLINDDLRNLDIMISLSIDHGNTILTRLNGVEKTSISVGAVTGSVNNFLIASELDFFNTVENFANIQVGEIIIYDRKLIASEIEQVETYLSDRWGIPSFLPTQLSGLQLWLDADDPSTIMELGGGVVDQWNDKSGQSNNAIAGVNSPITGISTINGKNTIDFDGINQYLIGASVNENVPLSSHTIFFVAHLDVTDETQCFLSWNDNNGTDNREVLCFTIIGEFISISTNGLGIFDLIQDDLQNTDMLVSVTVNHGDRIVTRLNGVEKTLNGISAVNSTDSFLIGAEKDPVNLVNNFMDAHVGEIIIYDRKLPFVEIKQVETYLSARWGISVT